MWYTLWVLLTLDWLILLNRLCPLMETSHLIPASRICKPGWYYKFREQSNLLNQSTWKILLIGDSVISNLGRYHEIWKKCFSSNNALNFGIPEDKIQHVLCRIQNLSFSNNNSIQYIFILCGANNLDHNPPGEFPNGIILSGISAKKNNDILLLSYLFHYSLAVKKTRLEEERLISLTSF